MLKAHHALRAMSRVFGAWD